MFTIRHIPSGKLLKNRVVDDGWSLHIPYRTPFIRKDGDDSYHSNSIYISLFSPEYYSQALEKTFIELFFDENKTANEMMVDAIFTDGSNKVCLYKKDIPKTRTRQYTTGLERAVKLLKAWFPNDIEIVEVGLKV